MCIRDRPYGVNCVAHMECVCFDVLAPLRYLCSVAVLGLLELGQCPYCCACVVVSRAGGMMFVLCELVGICTLCVFVLFDLCGIYTLVSCVFVLCDLCGIRTLVSCVFVLCDLCGICTLLSRVVHMSAWTSPCLWRRECIFAGPACFG